MLVLCSAQAFAALIDMSAGHAHKAPQAPKPHPQISQIPNEGEAVDVRPTK